MVNRPKIIEIITIIIAITNGRPRCFGERTSKDVFLLLVEGTSLTELSAKTSYFFLLWANKESVLHLAGM